MNGRLFSIEEANALLPTLIPLVRRAMAARKRIAAAEPTLRKLDAKSSGNGGGSKVSQIVAELTTIEAISSKIEELGCQLKDLNIGLIDFPAEREGRIVLLCWQYGEERVEWWHDTDAGFAGRQRL